MVSFGQKLKLRKTVVQEDKSCSVQKTAGKKPKYSRNETILKIGHLAEAIAHAKAIAFAKWSVWVKIKMAKNMRKTVVEEEWSCSVQKTTGKKHQIFEK